MFETLRNVPIQYSFDAAQGIKIICGLMAKSYQVQGMSKIYNPNFWLRL